MQHKLLRVNKEYIFIAIGILLISCIAFSLNAKTDAQTAPANPKPGSSLGQRIAQRKKERNIKLDEKSANRLEDRCVRTQNKIRAIRASYSEATDSRNNAYRKIDAKLWMVIGSLKLINQDTFKLEQQRSQLATKAKVFDNSATQLGQALDDAVAMNCAADVVGFKALIETARLYNAQVHSSFGDIRTFVIDQLQPTLTQYANDLKLKPSTEQ